ncbi:hypothetical protein OIE62_00625 [Streptomyces scopuliridis]|uniref:Uncharacterized protein n=1 Tax=Streptomyces scopuliridis TaxID=452529 RepID=A0ACD4ZWI8_9ACTN|nr:hypothetical protein [Streptomyces scopuliridis]WSC02774.1 hypothetical protein OG835_41205 [Streptomyces scopuliridis]WSC03692.1 hypothetical protein OIE62_00625 [Streptomyces scopuliridis]
MRHSIRITTAAVLGAFALASLAGCSDSGATDTGKAEPIVATTSAAALPPPRSAPSPAATLSAPPKQGEVRVEEGPFTDRVRLTRLALTGESAVGGHLVITSDVSDVLALELRAAYYDAEGRLIGTGSFEYQEEGHDAQGGEHHDGPRAAGEGIDFTVPAAKRTGTGTGTAIAAVLSVPVLVNE